MNNEEKDAPKEKEKRSIDPYLESLEFIAQYYEKTVSRDSLVSGTLTHGNFMNLESFIKASSKIGLISKIVTRKLENISKLALPSLLTLKNNRACVLLDIDLEDSKVKVMLPGLSGETVMSIEKLKSEFTNQVVLIKNDYQFKNRLHKDIIIENPRHWFTGAMNRNKEIYIKVAIAAVILNLFVIITPLYTMNVYDRVLPNNAIDTLWVFSTGVFIVMIFDFVLKLIRSHYLGLANKKADIIMSNKIFEQLLNIRLDQKPASTGMFLSRLQSFESVRDFFSTATIAAVVDLPFIFFFVGIIFYIGGETGWVSVATIFIAFAFSWYMQKPIKAIIEKSAKEDQIKLTALNETVAGLEIIKAVRGQNRMKAQFENSLNQTAYYSEKSQHLSQTVNYFTAFLSQLSNIVIVIIGVYLASKGEMTMGAIIATTMLNGRVVAPISQIVSMIIRYDRTMLSFKNIDELMKMQVERDDKVYLSRPNLSGDIIFKNVTFSYKNQNFEALKNLNLHIKQGEKVAIIGKIGSGKSTLSKLIMNLYTPTSGSIMYDGTDVRLIDPVDLRRSIGYVPQEPFLFLGTIKDNITIGENFASDEDLIEASKIAGLNTFLGKHEAGFDLLVGERGDGLSGGERQSITLARALISKPNLIMLDEPTNSMDSQTEQAFITNMQKVIKDKTVLIMTHKMSILQLVDRVIVLHDGQIIADGPKMEVLNSLKSESK
ncbi:MAG: type I secretion system permease/ATPase [Arcobacter sp.]|nr:type I secretion system permease/ATPase [Arcobacter sp.]